MNNKIFIQLAVFIMFLFPVFVVKADLLPNFELDIPYVGEGEGDPELFDTGTGSNEEENSTGSNGSNGSQTINNPIKADSFGELIRDILNIVIVIGVPIITLGVIYSGFLFVEARGNESKLTEAKQTFMYTIIGAAIVLGALVIVEVIEGTVNQLR